MSEIYKACPTCGAMCGVEAHFASEYERLDRVLTEVMAERMWQDEKWGGPAHDDTHSVQEFVAFIHEHAEKAIALGTSPEMTCGRLVEVAALAVACVQSIRRRTCCKPT